MFLGILTAQQVQSVAPNLEFLRTYNTALITRRVWLAGIFTLSKFRISNFVGLYTVSIIFCYAKLQFAAPQSMKSSPNVSRENLKANFSESAESHMGTQ